MKTITISKLKNELSRFLRLVKQGETIIVLDRKEPVAEISPVCRQSRHATDHLASLESAGIIRRGDSKQLEGWTVPRGKSVGVLSALLDERRTGR